MTRNNLAKLAVVSLICTLSCLAPASAKAGVLESDRIAMEQPTPTHPHWDPHRRPASRDDVNAPTRRPANREPRSGQGKGPIPGRTGTPRARYGSQLDS